MRTSVAAFVPICGELLWIDLFMLVNSVPGIKIFCLEVSGRHGDEWGEFFFPEGSMVMIDFLVVKPTISEGHDGDIII